MQWKPQFYYRLHCANNSSCLVKIIWKTVIIISYVTFILKNQFVLLKNCFFYLHDHEAHKGRWVKLQKFQGGKRLDLTIILCSPEWICALIVRINKDIHHINASSSHFICNVPGDDHINDCRMKIFAAS